MQFVKKKEIKKQFANLFAPDDAFPVKYGLPETDKFTWQMKRITYSKP